MLFVPLSNTALVGVADHDTGAASALVNATQQVGAAIGTALFSTIYSSAFAWAAGVMLFAGVIALVLIEARAEDLPADALVHAG